ncbi:MAG: NAD-dependent epimerase/dehydratase family protein [Candidatus Accumulibacter sp.]|uniref:NAD-dependent epimerase/dehydratase family protein n=1 Tax=Accumulibacter sp. TaxID=2053492 RepID=UPI0025E804AB|nr:NAD-dependent epimerase/dehydratase family protein [Accumulibacter sp.]MCP5249202.1 NAD-dependent epimerase/dehydratase family protein [Accumulibacter sp.]
MLRPVPEADLRHILEHSEPLWNELRGQRLFITGGTGFFGLWLLEAMRAANERLGSRISATVLSRDPPAFSIRAPHLASQPGLTWLRGDVRHFASPQGQYDHIIHAAAESSTDLNERRPDTMLDTIVCGTRRVLDFATSAGIKSLLLVSSGAVYGRQPPELQHVPETLVGGPDVNSPHSAYAEGKRVAELLCAIAEKQCGIHTKIGRCFTFVGPHLPLGAHFAAGNFLRDAVAGGPIIVSGDGTAYRSYMYPADLVIWLMTILVRGKNNRPYNVGSDQSVSIAELAHRIANTVGSNRRLEVRGQPSGKAPERYVPHTGRARVELGLDTTISLDTALQRTFTWLTKAEK